MSSVIGLKLLWQTDYVTCVYVNWACRLLLTGSASLGERKREGIPISLSLSFWVTTDMQINWQTLFDRNSIHCSSSPMTRSYVTVQYCWDFKSDTSEDSCLAHIWKWISSEPKGVPFSEYHLSQIIYIMYSCSWIIKRNIWCTCKLGHVLLHITK